eukprot:COSAG02_NODE_4254_length_5581_cov_2.070595_5_plen_183_part_00
MDCEERMAQQVALTSSHVSRVVCCCHHHRLRASIPYQTLDVWTLAPQSPGTTVWIYRNAVKALPWMTSVRKKLLDPKYSDWFLPFSGAGNYSVPACDHNFSPPKCSRLYHDQLQTPGFPHGDGDCLAPGCDVGPGLPVGEYIFNPLAANVSVNGQTMLEWYIDEHLFGPEIGGNPNVSGFYL